MHLHGKTRCKRLYAAVLHPGKKKALRRVGCKAKEKPRQRGRGCCHLFFSSRSARAAQSSCVSSSVKSYSARSWSASALLHPPSYRAAALLDTSFNMVFLFPGFCPFLQYIIPQAPLTGLAKSFYLLALNSALKNQKKNRMQEKITCRTPLYHAKTLVAGFAAALCVYIRVQRLE